MMYDDIEILLVEDNFQDAEMTIRALKKNNLAKNLFHLSDGADALDFIFARGKFSDRQIDKKPRLILMDLKMPKVTGFEVLETARTDTRTKNIPVVILTSSKEDSDINKCYKLGANGYVVKPVSFDAFQRAIEHLGIFWIEINQTSTL